MSITGFEGMDTAEVNKLKKKLVGDIIKTIEENWEALKKDIVNDMNRETEERGKVMNSQEEWSKREWNKDIQIDVFDSWI